MEKCWLESICASSIVPPEENEVHELVARGKPAALVALHHLLPDASIELFKQHADEAFTQFRLFGELPEELRIMIWRAAFPRNRTVQVELSPSFQILHSHTPPPATLHTTRESRAETLKFYVSLLNPCRRRPILFHPALDTMYFHGRRNDPLLFMQNTSYLTWRSMSGISKIQSLKIRHMYYGGGMQGWIKFGRPRRSLYGHGSILEPDRGGLRFFHGLEELILVSKSKILGSANYLGILNHPNTLVSVPPDDVIFTLDTQERIGEYLQAFKDFFAWEREKSPNCKIPEIVVKQGRNLRQDRWYLGRLSKCLEDA